MIRSAGSETRYKPELPFPAYAYVPGRHPHPQRDPRGHSHGFPEPAPPPAEAPDPVDWGSCAAFLYGVDLFNHGYYWEAHEAWEGLWRLYPPEHPGGRLLQALIKLTASGVKSREGRPRGVARHAAGAAEILHALPAAPPLFGLHPTSLATAADTLVQRPDRALSDLVRLEPE